MYYYIFDPKKCRKKSQVEAIKDQLAKIGISGEFSVVSSMQSASDLAEAGLRKQYSTIVAVGGDDIINQIADKLIGRTEAMGIIPLETSAEIEDLIGTRNWKDAIDILRFRRIKEIHLGMMGSGRHFLTSAELDLKKPTEVTIEFKSYIIQAKVKSLMISNVSSRIKKIGPEFLDVIIQSELSKNSGLLASFAGLFKSPEVAEKNLTMVRARSMRIFSNKSIIIKSGGTVISKTPQYIESTDEELRLIVGKHTEI